LGRLCLEELKAKAINENTKKSTTFWLKVWQDWALARQYHVDIEIIPHKSWIKHFKSFTPRCEQRKAKNTSLRA
jgi:hypothetical protein